MSFEEAMSAEVSRDEVRHEILRHGADPDEFFRETGDRSTYRGSDVLEWLGY